MSLRLPGRRISALRDVETSVLEDVAGEMPMTLWKRAKHVVEENSRVQAMVQALVQRDVGRVGNLLLASHKSLRELFEVSTKELDFLVEWGMSHGALGARLVGGGFGGVTLHLLPTKLRDDYVEGLKDAYFRKFGLSAEVLCVCNVPGRGAYLVR